MAEVWQSIDEMDDREVRAVLAMLAEDVPEQFQWHVKHVLAITRKGKENISDLRL